MPFDARFPHVLNPRILQVLQVWLAAAGRAAMPRRSAIDPAALGRNLDIVWLCDVVRPGPRYRYRLAGERVNEVYGMSLAGRFMDEIIPAATQTPVLARYHRVVAERGLSHTAGSLYLSSDKIYAGERIAMPLSDDGRTVDALLGATAFDWPTAARRSEQRAVGPTVTFTPIDLPEAP